MKIRRIKATPINYRLEAPYVWVFGELDGFSPTIVEVETEDGLVGIGEAPTPAAAAVINDVLAPRLVGRDAFDIAGAEEVCLPFWSGVQIDQRPHPHHGLRRHRGGAVGPARQGVEPAALPIARRRRAQGHPLHRLFFAARRWCRR